MLLPEEQLELFQGLEASLQVRPWHLTPDTWHLTPDTWHQFYFTLQSSRPGAFFRPSRIYSKLLSATFCNLLLSSCDIPTAPPVLHQVLPQATMSSVDQVTSMSSCYDNDSLMEHILMNDVCLKWQLLWSVALASMYPVNLHPVIVRNCTMHHTLIPIKIVRKNNKFH